MRHALSILFGDIYNIYKYLMFGNFLPLFPPCQFFCLCISRSFQVLVSSSAWWSLAWCLPFKVTGGTWMLFLTFTAVPSRHVAEQHWGVGTVPIAGLREWTFPLLRAASTRTLSPRATAPPHNPHHCFHDHAVLPSCLVDSLQVPIHICLLQQWTLVCPHFLQQLFLVCHLGVILPATIRFIFFLAGIPQFLVHRVNSCLL
jgi:hypothetical protein